MGEADARAETAAVGDIPVRVAQVIARRPDLQDSLEQLIAVAKSRLPKMRVTATDFVHSVRDCDGHLLPVGTSSRYSAIVLMGAQALPESEQSRLLGGRPAADLCQAMLDGADRESDLGALALLAWAAGEMRHPRVDDLHQMLVTRLHPPRTLQELTTVEIAWALAAFSVLARITDVDETVAWKLRKELEKAFVPTGELFRHHPSTRYTGTLRSHVGSFADQIYPIQALALASHGLEDPSCLELAEACASVVVKLQGESGQWWWHYDCRKGSVVEPYPVYAVHQDAMAPMALFELVENGGTDHVAAICRGLDWLAEPPEIERSLVDPGAEMIWRKVARREPGKLLRVVRSGTTRIHHDFRLGWLDRVFPPSVVDYECRPYHLGWVLYSWFKNMPRTESD